MTRVRTESTLFWIALVLAFSPTALHLLRTWYLQPENAWTLLIWLLLISVVRVDPLRSERRRLGGAALLLLALSLQTLGIAGDSWSIAHYALPLAALGIALWWGRPTLRVALLAWAAIPLPTFVTTLFSPHSETIAATLTARVAGFLGLAIHARGPALHSGDALLDIRSYDTGLHLAWCFAAFGWYAGLREHRAWPRLVLKSAGFALLAPAWQAAGLLVAAFLLTRGATRCAQLWLVGGVWSSAVLALLLWIHFQARARQKNLLACGGAPRAAT